MRARSRHPRLVSAACRAYDLVICLYPREFRRAFAGELAVTFRNRVEDVLDGGGIGSWLAFVVHIGLDTLRTRRTLIASGEWQDASSLLGLAEGEVARGSLARARVVDIHLMAATAGVALTLAGWFAYFVILPRYVH